MQSINLIGTIGPAGIGAVVGIGTFEKEQNEKKMKEEGEEKKMEEEGEEGEESSLTQQPTFSPVPKIWYMYV